MENPSWGIDPRFQFHLDPSVHSDLTILHPTPLTPLAERASQRHGEGSKQDGGDINGTPGSWRQ